MSSDGECFGASGHASNRRGDLDRRGRLLSLLTHAMLNGDAPNGDRRNGSGSGTAPDDGRIDGEGHEPNPPPRGLPGLRQRLERVCVLTVREVGVDGAGVTVMGSVDAGLAGHRDQLAATGALTRRLEDLQLTAGEGPCLDAYATGVPVLAGDLVAETTRWVGFGPEAVAAGAAAVFSLPLQLGAVRLGTLDLHRATSGPLSGEKLANALVLASLATELLLELAATPDPRYAPDADASTDPDADQAHGLDAGWLPDVHAEVHVASGMVSARHDIDVVTALLRIRAHAFATGEPIRDLARRIVDRDGLVPDDDPHHFDPDDPDTSHTDVDLDIDPREDGPPAPGPSPDSSPEGDD